MGDMGFGKCRFRHKDCTIDAEVKNEHDVPMCKTCFRYWSLKKPRTIPSCHSYPLEYSREK